MQRLQRLSAGLFAPVVFAFVIPFNIAVRNLDELTFTSATWWMFILVGVLLLAVALPAAWWSGHSSRASAAVKALAGSAIVVMLWDTARFADAALEMPRAVRALLDLSLLAGTIWALKRMLPATVIRVTAVMTPVIAAVSIADLVSATAGAPPEAGKPESQNEQRLERSPAANAMQRRAAMAGNIYHFVFDQYQSQGYQYLLDHEPERVAEPFTYYPRFRASAYSTFVSNAVLLGGRLYDGSVSPLDWIRTSYSSGLISWLDQAGAGVHLYPFHGFYCPPGVETCLPATEIAEPQLSGTAILADLWFLRLQPGPYRKANIGDRWDYDFSISSLFTGVDPPEFLRRFGLFSVQQFRQLTAEEKLRPASGQYVFAHLMIPHAPLVVDGGCAQLPEMDKEEEHRRESELYLDQIRCVHKLVDEFARELRRLGRFEDALLVVHSDHGQYFEAEGTGQFEPYLPHDKAPPVRPFQRNRVDSDDWTPINVDIRSAAFLAIKFPGQRQRARSELPVQTIDIAPTILHHARLSVPRLDGEAIQTMEPGWTREAIFLTYEEGPRAAFAARPGGRIPSDFARYRLRGNSWTFDGIVRPRRTMASQP